MRSSPHEEKGSDAIHFRSSDVLEMKLQQLKSPSTFVQGALCGQGLLLSSSSGDDPWQVSSTSPAQPSRGPPRLEEKDFLFKLTFNFPPTFYEL